MSGVVPGKYSLTARCQPGRVLFRSARFNDGTATQDILDAGLDLTGGSGRADIEVVLSNGGGAVTGKVTDGDAPAPSRLVALVPEPAIRWKAARLRFGESDADGKFLVEGVAPGTYRLYAWPRSTAANSYIEPAFLKRYEDQAVKVEVAAGQAVTADLKVVRP